MNWAWTILRYVGGVRSIVISIFPSSATCSAHAYGKNFKQKKTTESEYVTVEMIRDAASAVVEALGMPPSARATIYKRTADTITYHLRRNREARKSHTKTRRRRFAALGTNVEKLPSCDPYDSS